MSVLYPHEKLIKDNNVDLSKLDSDTKGFISDFKQTIRGINMLAAKTGNLVIKPETEAKLRRIDKSICNGILNYLEESEEWSDENKPNPNPNPNPTPVPVPNPVPAPNQNPPTPNPNPTPNPTPNPNPTPKKSGFMMGIGFYEED